jgi:hypothetical protein
VATNGGGTSVATPTEAALVVARYELFGKLAPIGYVLASAIPIYASVPIAQALAGRQTNFTVTISVTLALSIVLGLGNLVQWFKNRGQSKELIRLRGRVSKLEGQVETLKANTP